MAPLSIFWKISSALLPFADFIYILQIEEYSSSRFLRWLPRFFFRRNFQVRQKLVWTPRVQMVFFLSVTIWIFGIITILLAENSILLLSGILWLLCVPIAVLLANALLHLPFSLLHTYKRIQGAKKIAHFKRTGTVVAVIGSFGKTTTKNFLEQFARYNFRVQMTPGNTNTSSGIASWLLTDIKPHTNLLLIEAEGYSAREYRQIGNMINADIVLVTSIGDQHLERLGSHKALAKAIGEVVSTANKKAHIICTQQTKDALPRGVLSGRRLHIVSESDVNRALAQECARIIGVPENIIADTSPRLEIPERRQKLSLMYGYEAIDDSYNISWTTAKAGIATAKENALKRGKKLLVVTAGIMELGREHEDKNEQLGQLLAQEADFTVVLETIFSQDIARGLGTAPHRKVPSLAVFLQNARGIFPPHEWFLLMQPEMHDLYY